MKDYSTHITTDDIRDYLKDYLKEANLESVDFFTPPATWRRTKDLETLFHHFTGVVVEDGELVIDIESDHNQNYQCSVDTGMSISFISSTEDITELKDKINNMRKARVYAVGNNLKVRDQLFSFISSDIASEYKELEKKIKEIKEERTKEIQGILEKRYGEIRKEKQQKQTQEPEL